MAKPWKSSRSLSRKSSRMRQKIKWNYDANLPSEKFSLKSRRDKFDILRKEREKTSYCSYIRQSVSNVMRF